MNTHTELEPVILGYRGYTDHKDLYTCTAQIHQYGDVGIVYAMHGDGLLRNLCKDLEEGKLKEAGIKRLEGYVLPIVGRFIRNIIADTDLSYSVRYKCTHNGRKFIWVVVERVEDD